MNKRITVFFIVFITYCFHAGAQLVNVPAIDSLGKREMKAGPDDKKNISAEARRAVERGDNFMSKGSLGYENALKEYLKAYQLHPDNSYLCLKVALCYLSIKRYKKNTIEYLEKVYNQNKAIDKKIHYYLGQAYQLDNNPEQAIDEYQAYIDQFKAESKNLKEEEIEAELKEVTHKIHECKTNIYLRLKPAPVNLFNLGDSVNSPYPDYDPFVLPGEKVMIFTSRRETARGNGTTEVDGEFFEDIYITYNVNGWLTKAKRFGSLSKRTNDAIVGLSFDGKKMIVYRDTEQGDLYVSEFKDGIWQKAKKMKNINSPYMEKSACFSIDMKTIYFISNRPGGYGGLDIYKSTLVKENEWSKPVNLGPKINSEYDETRVFLHPNSRTLYFSSKGHNGIGGYDIFKSVLKADSSWSDPVNVGVPINTVDDDISYYVMPDGKHAYYASSSNTQYGSTDIQIVNFEQPDSSQVLTHYDSLIAKITPFISNASENQLAFDMKEIKDIDVKANQNKFGDSLTADSLAAVTAMREGLKGVNGNLAGNNNNGDVGATLIPLTADDLKNMKDNETVRVIVALQNNEFTDPNYKDLNKKREEIRKMQDKVLASIPAESKKDIKLFDLQNGFTGEISKSALEALRKNGSIKGLYRETPVLASANENKISTNLNGVNQGEEHAAKVRLTPDDIRMMKDNETALVTIALKNNQSTSQDINKRREEIKKMQDKLIASLPAGSANKMKFVEKENGFSIEATKDVLDMLLKNDNVDAIYRETTSELAGVTSPGGDAMEAGSNASLTGDISFRSILFDFDKFNLLPEAVNELNKVIVFMQKNTNAKIDLLGHADSKGSAEYNYRLSQRRVMAAYNYLVAKGVDKKRLTASQFGETRPTAPNENPDGSDNPDGRRLNRRVDILNK